MEVLLADPKSDPRPKPYRALGQRIKELREAAGLSQPELADALGISPGYPGHLEVGRNRPDPTILQNMAKLLHGDYQELALLAGYLSRPSAEALDDPEVQRFIQYPKRKQRWLNRMAELTDSLLEEVPDDEGKGASDSDADNKHDG